MTQTWPSWYPAVGIGWDLNVDGLDPLRSPVPNLFWTYAGILGDSWDAPERKVSRKPSSHWTSQLELRYWIPQLLGTWYIWHSKNGNQPPNQGTSLWPECTADWFHMPKCARFQEGYIQNPNFSCFGQMLIHYPHYPMFRASPGFCWSKSHTSKSIYIKFRQTQ